MQRTKNKKTGVNYLALSLFCISFILVIITLLSCLQKFEINFLETTIIPYDDRVEESFPGKSEIIGIGKNLNELKMSYILRTGFTYPYSGVIILFKNSNGNFLDCTRFDALKIRIASSQLSDCKIYLTLFDKNITRNNVPVSERYLKKELILNSIPKTYSIPFNQFVTPEWWFQKNNITLKDAAPVDFSKVIALKIESGSTAKTGITDTITISGLSFTKRPDRYMLSLILFLLLSNISYAIFKLLPRKKNDPVIITYDKKDVRSYRDIDAQKISDYLAKHFSEPELSIINMGESLGLSQKKTAKIMNDEFKMSFKQYLTSIRIHEAKRLLLETDRLVIDIALEVGFNSISHFNRVFKTSTQLSPLEFRNKQAADVK